ncbi:maleylpyruvate isomerase N-terminal domain-containing protein [Aeromicrobium sp.]|uniref:maleylpyruvate isomerase N-terminal domain-containing protein n=1 Tax=Aeromicrobium sp. TaxID=1871063 RepID=UPI0030BE42C3
MNHAPGPTLAVEQELVIRSIDRETQALLASVLGGFLEIDLQFAPVLDGFTGGHVITHLSREADRMADALLEATGLPVPPLDGERQWEVDPGGLRPAAVLIEDFVESSSRLKAAMAGVHDWSSLAHGVREVPARRLIQLVVHHADLQRSWESVSHEEAAVAVSRLSSVFAAEMSDLLFVVRPDQPLISSAREDGRTVLTGDARALLAWASGRLAQISSGSAADLPPRDRRVWF